MTPTAFTPDSDSALAAAAKAAAFALSRPRPTLVPVSCGSALSRRTTLPGLVTLTPHAAQYLAALATSYPQLAHCISDPPDQPREPSSPRPSRC